MIELTLLMVMTECSSSNNHLEKIDEKNITEKQKTCNNIEREKDEKKIPRNKACPCGSKKKYKSCCGTAAGRSVNNVIENGKGRKDKKNGKKGGSLSHGSTDGSSPDMGALCI